MEVELVWDFSDEHEGDVFLTHRWQKHVHLTTRGTLIVPVYHVPPNASTGQTHVYRREDDATEFTRATTLSDAGLDVSGDVNAGIVVEDDAGTLYATGHSNPPPSVTTVANRVQDRLTPLFGGYASYVGKAVLMAERPKRVRTNLLFRSDNDGKEWELARDRTDQRRRNPPHPHNAFWDDATGTLWWLVGHDGKRLQRYDPATDEWGEAYTGTAIEAHDRLPLAMNRGNGRLWLGCEVTGPDKRHLYYSEDDGETWQNVDHEFEHPPGANNDGIWSISFEPRDSGPDAVYVGGGRSNSGRAFVAKSEDNGQTWEVVYEGTEASDAWTTVYQGDLFVADGPGPLVRSRDGGASYETVYDPGHEPGAVDRKYEECGIVCSESTGYLVDGASLYRVTEW